MEKSKEQAAVDQKVKEAEKKEAEKKDGAKEEVLKVKVGDKEMTLDEVNAELAKVKEIEAEYNKRYIELSNVHKELEPVMQLQQFLTDNPDKAGKIAEILEGKEIKAEKFETDIPEVKKLKDELDELKKSLTETTSSITQQQRVKDEQEFLSRELTKLSSKYEDLDEEVLYAKLLSTPNLGQIPRPNLAELMEKIASDLDKRAKDKRQQYVQRYLLEKEKADKETRGEGKGGAAGAEKIEVKGLEVRDGSAKKAAMDYLQKLGLSKKT